MKKRVFVTGATGCVGHYVLDELRKQPNVEIHLAARSKKRMKVNIDEYEDVFFHEHDLEHPEKNKDIIFTCHIIIHIATTWRNNREKATRMNRDKTIEMFELTDPKIFEKAIYFSTASILGKGNRPLEEAKEYGTGYVMSKAKAYEAIRKHPMSDKIITVFPTVVFGGDKTHPYSHISEGIFPNKKKLKLMRFLDPEFSFHFLHSRDIAQIAVHLALNTTEKNDYVIGHPVISAKETFKTLAEYMGYKVYFQVLVSSRFVMFLCKIFRVKLDRWARFMINNPHFVYNTVSPEDFGLKSQFPDLTSVIRDVEVNLDG